MRDEIQRTETKGERLRMCARRMIGQRKKEMSNAGRGRGRREEDKEGGIKTERGRREEEERGRGDRKREGRGGESNV